MKRMRQMTALAICLAGAATSTSAAAGGFKVLYSFQNIPDGNNPAAAMIDVGGTFTKAVLVDDDSHEIVGRYSTLTTHADPRGVAAGVVREGAPLAGALASKKRFPGLISMFARLGEQTGQLPAMLERISRGLIEDPEALRPGLPDTFLATLRKGRYEKGIGEDDVRAAEAALSAAL